MKIQYKIVYVLIGIFFSYTLLFSGLIYYSISDYAFTDFYKRLEIRAIATAQIQFEDQRDVDIIRELRQDYMEILPNEQDYILEITEDDQLENTELRTILPSNFFSNIITQGQASINLGNTYYYGIKYSSPYQKDYAIIISAENYFITHHISYLRNLLFTSLAIALFIIILISFLFSKKMIQPINDIINKVKEIGSENLHLRLKVPLRNDSISLLSKTFNDMLDRLETTFETQKNFISNASHELNTPLTSIIGEADVSLSKIREPIEYIKSINTILEEAEKLNKKTKALLLLAQTGYDGKVQKFDMVRIDQLILDVRETVEKINNDNKIAIDFSLLPESPEQLKIKGNEQLLHLALSNIILNGCKYSNHQTVSIALGVADHQVIIIVKDKGIGIPKEDLQYIYDPFFRASNTKNFEGYGIGLPLSRNIIKIHQGKLIITSAINQGTTVQINLPIGNYTI